LFYTEEKLKQRIADLYRLRYREAQPIKSFAFLEDKEGAVGARPPALDESWGQISLGDRWQGWDKYAWLAAEIDVPADWKDRKVLLRLDLGRTGGGNNSGFESLLYLNGEPYQGVDSNHQEVFLPAELAGTRILVQIRLWSGLNGGGRPVEQEYQIRTAELCWLDQDADDFYYWGRAVLQTVAVLEQEKPERHDLLSALNRCYKLIDYAEPGSDEFYETVALANEQLKKELERIEKHHAVTVHCVGHTHIDVAWLWRLKHTREKAARSFSTVIRLMEMYPDYIFQQAQPQLYEYIKNDYPDIYAKIKKLVAEKRWEADGGMWVEADCNLTSGESLVRQILFGTRFLKQEFGVDCTYLWLPDVFGYSWALPQILKKSGLNTFMTTKISWNQYNRMPHDTFMWRGIDGTEILTHFITTTDVNPNGWFYTYNGDIRAGTVLGSWQAYRNKDFNKDILLSYGYGDGGGGVNRDMLEMRRRLDKMPGIPYVKTTRAGDYFTKLHEAVANTDQYVHTWDGELYLEYHRGTYTSQAYNKKMNRKLELLYRETEWLNTLGSISKGSWDLYPQEEINEGWKIILRNQFHDIIPGSSIREVYEDSTVEYAESEAIATNAWKGASKALVADAQNAFTIFNSAPWTRDDVISIPVSAVGETGQWFDCSGNALQAQRQSDNWVVYVTNIPSMGYKVIRFDSNAEAAGTTEKPFAVTENSITTPFYEITWNEKGQLSSIFDRENNRQVLAKGELGNVLQVFEDKPMAHDAWDIDIYYQEKMRVVDDLVNVSVVEEGPLEAVIRFEWNYRNSTITQDMVLSAVTRRIDFRTTVDWHERQQLLKVAFPVDIRATEATYDIQFGNVKRPTHWNTSWDWARFETVGHQWADLSERGYGVSLLNDCKYGYDIKNNVLRLSLIKSAVHPDYMADQGPHEFTYSLLPHAADWYEGRTVQEAWYLNNPLAFKAGQAEVSELSFLNFDAPNVMIDAVKKSEDGSRVIVRLHEFSGQSCQVSLRSDYEILDWQEVNLMEKPEGPVTEGPIEFTIKPYEIRTFSLNVTKKA